MREESIEINYGNKATVNMGDYENLSPMYNIKRIIKVCDGVEIDIQAELNEMRKIVDSNLKANVDNIKNAKKAKDVGNFRFYTKDGKQYISVTSVLNPEPKTPEEEARLKPYGDRGTSLHKKFSYEIENGGTREFTKEEKDACASVGGFDGYEFWFQKDPRFDFSLSEVEVFNDAELYAGRYDADGFFTAKEGEFGKSAMYDLKSGSLTKQGIEKAFLQLTAYNESLDKPKDLLIIIPIGPKAKKEPMIITREESKKYWEIFKAKRAEFKKRYGV